MSEIPIQEYQEPLEAQQHDTAHHQGMKDMVCRAGAVMLTSAAFMGMSGGNQAQANDTTHERSNSDAPDIEAVRAFDMTETISPEEQYCIDKAIYSFRGGIVGYGKPDRQGRYYRVKQTVAAKKMPENCDDLVTREIGVQQLMNGRPNTSYSVVSWSDEAINKTVTQRGYRAWKCFKTFSQRVFLTATTTNGYGDQEIYNSRKTKPNC